MKKAHMKALTAGIALVIGCLMMSHSEARTTAVTIDMHEQKQVMHSFGASDAWTCQFVGENWPIEKRGEIADLLFSREVDAQGNPRGIGLSMWRFYIGAGSAEQGAASRIHTPWHRAECFLGADGSYDWTKQKGQRWFLEAANERGVPYLLAFSCSPPVHMTLNGIAHGDEGRWSLNLKEGALPEFADFLAEVARHFHETGLTLDYISPINEPEWDWHTDKQEGTPATNAEVAELARLLSERFQRKRLPSKVLVGEAASLKFLIDAQGKAARGDLVRAYWDASSPHYLGKEPAVARVISGHSYFTTWPLSDQISVRERLRERLEEIDPSLAYWQTEFCILEANDEITHGHGRDLGMDTALYVARVIHNDITIANAAHWSWWLAVSQADYKDGLIYIEGEAPEKDGRVLPSKLLWALGNYSRFVRPGMVRVGVSHDDDRTPLDASTSLMVSAFLDKKTRQLVIVAVNPTTEAQAIRINGVRVRGSTFDSYTTSRTRSLRRGSVGAERVSIAPRSVVTLVGAVE